MKCLYLPILFLCLSILSINGQHFPGGVTDAEVWYIADWEDLTSDAFENSALTDINLRNCGVVNKELFNFNPSIYTDKLCLKYDAPLENTTGRDVFFVGEPYKTKPALSHLGTLWRLGFSSTAETDSIVRNFFDLNNKNAYSREIYDEYISDKNANVNFYHTNHYNIDKKFKSYGQLGETSFYIGAKVNFDPDFNFPDNTFWGNFPEFISFTRELSSNERNRVESYLALKYGLTLYKTSSYLSSENKVYWDKSNNDLFPYGIFGFGKDDISSLNQLQSESTHLKEHLVAAIEKIAANNMVKQQSVFIPNEHFLVFGDNGGKPALLQENSKKIKFWEKVWLAQRTGESVHNFPIYFRLTLTDEIMEYLSANPSETLWLLKDRHVSNDEVSDFENEHIEYYAGDVDLDSDFGNFSNVLFDSDINIYDQYTFGVGPKMIVQAQVQGCKDSELEIRIDITGGKPPYTIIVESSVGGFEVTTDNNYYVFDAVAEVEYHITVIDATGLEFEMSITPEPWDFELDLGPDQTLTPSNPEIVLDAGVGIDDPDATYQWYKDGTLLPDNGSTLTVDEPGVYQVYVTSGDQSCAAKDDINIFTEGMDAEISVMAACTEAFNSLFIDIQFGFAPYITTLEGPNGTVNYAHSGSTTIFDLAYGTYIVIVTDSEGNTVEEVVELTMPPEGLGLDIYTQLDDNCSYDVSCINYNYPEAPFFFTGFETPPFVVDASLGVVLPNMQYQWYQDGVPLDIIGPEITFVPGAVECYNGNPKLPQFTVIITDVITNCTATQSFFTRALCPLIGDTAPLVENEENEIFNIDTQLEDLKAEGSMSTRESLSTLVTRVYPNPSQVNATFTYEVKASEIFDGTIEVFTFAGAKVETLNIKEKAHYKVPLELKMSGTYLIKTTTSNGKTKIDRIIIN